jgi:hypothetical protein
MRECVYLEEVVRLAQPSLEKLIRIDSGRFESIMSDLNRPLGHEM